MNTPADSSAGALDIRRELVVVLDFGSQYTRLIARRVREARIYCEIHPYHIDPATLRALAPKGIILSGGPESVHDSDAPRLPEGIFDLQVPILGICYGMQAMAARFEGEVESASHREFGHAEVRAHGHSRLLEGIEDRTGPQGQGLLDVWMSHGDRVISLPPDFRRIASTANAPIAGIASESGDLYGLQFHPEVTHTPQGAAIIARFVHDICGCNRHWTPDAIIDDAVTKVQERTCGDRVLLALSGGVDSSVVAALLHRAIGDRLVCIFVDNGLLRAGEGDQVMATFAGHFGIDLIRIDAADRFFAALAGVEDPEEKRKRIGRLFIDIFEEEAAKIDNVHWLAQGTIYPDVIESAATGPAQVIKSHHNVGGLPERMRLKLIEPLRDLFKDEVRTIGLGLGLSKDIVFRHPFPGPGLAVRVLGEVRPEYVKTLQQADAIFIDELRSANLYDSVSQAFAVHLPIKSVGVTGDQRRYEYVIALRAVETIDFMTARRAPLPNDFLDRVANRIINEIEGISRVVYDISGKPPATIEWE
ncbi:glutamine-hydrolyzing GMP synthase [Thioalkalivibrio sp. HK1]|uniref:glutamine-hydrolyzing GMP synthase n=1 Tax=Thioalkalivibrio sp. HK1 TaxID=1469245 RepID=UPI000472B30C|nr:glutamine-hydrolyzing GMP synthase [Thioalkalivibrio sp. HK1]